MRHLPLAWATDIAVLEYGGSTVEDRGGDHLVVRIMGQPRPSIGETASSSRMPTSWRTPSRWMRVFDAEFPSVTWTAIGLLRMPTDRDAWTELGLELGVDDALVARSQPRRTTLPSGYLVRRIAGGDWETARHGLTRWPRTSVRARRSPGRTSGSNAPDDKPIASALPSGSFCRVRAGAFCRRRARREPLPRRRAWCGPNPARYPETSSTDAAHRRRGLASHLLGVAAEWALATVAATVG